MKRAFPLVTTQQYLHEREKWLREILRGESVSIIFFPKTDRYRRFHQLLEDKEFLKKFLGGKATFLFQITDFNVSLVEDRFDIEEHLARQLNLSNISTGPLRFDQWMQHCHKNNLRLVLLLLEAEKYLTLENKHILSILFNLVVDYAPMITVMSCYEVDITHPHHLSTISVIKDFFESIFYYPLYNVEDTRTFIQYLQKKWDMTIRPYEEEKIVTACGGHFWVVKEAVRELLDTGSWSIEAEGMRFRLESIYHSLVESEQTALDKVFTGKKNFITEERHSQGYLKRMNFLGPKNEFQIGLFRKFLENRTYVTSEFLVQEGKIMLNHVPLNTVLSRQEHRVLRVLLERRGEIVTRDEMAQVIWPSATEAKYSDWAIDQVMARLRKRLVELSLPRSLIQSVRGRGYRLVLL